MRKDEPWQWGKEQHDAFEQSKELLQSSDVLVHYNPDRQLILSCDASPYGIGAVLSHQMSDGSDKPIAYASRVLAPAEKNYAHIEKEGRTDIRVEQISQICLREGFSHSD